MGFCRRPPRDHVLLNSAKCYLTNCKWSNTATQASLGAWAAHFPADIIYRVRLATVRKNKCSLCYCDGKVYENACSFGFSPRPPTLSLTLNHSLMRLLAKNAERVRVSKARISKARISRWALELGPSLLAFLLYMTDWHRPDPNTSRPTTL